MKKRFIKIKDVSQIDTSKISVYDLNNRYIDPMGNLFGLKYNRAGKKIEIIKLERVHTSQTRQYQRKIFQNRESENIYDTAQGTESKNHDSDDIDNDKLFFEPDPFIEKVVSDAEIHKERINGIIMNINDSGIFPKEKKMDSTEFDDITRSLDIEGIQQLEKLDSYYRELTNYPRSITYYQAKIDNDGKDMIDLLAGNKEKTMRFIFLYEMSSSIKRVYKGLYKHIKRLDEFTDSKNPDEITGITKPQKQSFIDARTSIVNTISDIEKILETNNLLYDYALNPDYY
jgi:hypothetical protein